MRPFARIAARLAVGLAAVAPLLLPGTAAGAEDLAGLRRDYEARLAKRDEAGYALQREALERIADVRTPQALALLRDLLAAYGPSDRRVAALLLGALVRRGGPRELDDAVRWVEERKDLLLLDLLAGVAAAVEEPTTRAYLRESALRRATPPVKAVLARGLGDRKDPEAVMPLLHLLREADLEVRAEAMLALARIGDLRALPPLRAFLRNEAWRLRVAAAVSLGILGDGSAAGPLAATVAEDQTPLVVETAAEALAALGRPEAIPVLIDRLERSGGSDLRLEDALGRSLRGLTGKAFGTHAPSWRAWWDLVKDRPFRKEALDPAGETVEGPRYYDLPVVSSRLVFVLDVSRSMGWNDRLRVAKDELVRVLERLPRATRFNVVAYSDGAEAWADRLKEATRSNVAQAVRFVEKQAPDGGTGTWDALRVALRDEEADTIYFLSDGHPTVGEVVDPDLILADVARTNRWRRVRIYGIALLRGEPPAAFAGTEDPEGAEAFMRRLAQANGGLFKEIR